MATIVETGIKNIQACVILAHETDTPQLLVTYETKDADGNTVRRRENPDWFPTAKLEQQQAIMGLIEAFALRAKAESEIPLPEPAPDPAP
jgi:hypothetical protein